MDVITIALIAIAVWMLLLGVVVALCKAAAHADANVLGNQEQPTALSPRPAVHTPRGHPIARRA